MCTKQSLEVKSVFNISTIINAEMIEGPRNEITAVAVAQPENHIKHQIQKELREMAITETVLLCLTNAYFFCITASDSVPSLFTFRALVLLLIHTDGLQGHSVYSKSKRCQWLHLWLGVDGCILRKHWLFIDHKPYSKPFQVDHWSLIYNLCFRSVQLEMILLFLMWVSEILLVVQTECFWEADCSSVKLIEWPTHVWAEWKGRRGSSQSNKANYELPGRWTLFTLGSDLKKIHHQKSHVPPPPPPHVFSYG